MSYPSFEALPKDAAGLPIARNVWGPDDQIGTLNNISPEAVARAAALVRQGRRFNLNLPLHFPFSLAGTNAHRHRKAPRQTLIKESRPGLLIRDEKLDDFYTQSSTQWDGLTHIGDPVEGFYNGVRDEQVTQLDGTRNGIEHYVRFGLASRGVLLDLPDIYPRATGRPWSATGRQVLDAAELAQCLSVLEVELAPGDILMIRTGWWAQFLALPAAEREESYQRRDGSGLAGDLAMWKFLWDRRIAAVTADNIAVETLPFAGGQASLHLAIARLGLVLGELFDFETLAEDVKRDGDPTCFFVSVPLNLQGGVGSPANAIALR